MQWFFDVPEAVDYLRAIGARAATVNLVRRLVRSGAIPRTRIGKKLYIKKESLDSWFLKHQREMAPRARRRRK